MITPSDNSFPLPKALAALGQQRYHTLFPEQSATPALAEPLVKLLALSDFAFKVLSQTPQLSQWLLTQEDLSSRVAPPVFNSPLNDIDEPQAQRLLRQYRQRYWLKVAYLDLVLNNSIADSMAYISALSEQLIDSANQWAFAHVAKQNGCPMDEQQNPITMLVLGMGKLGGKELNYSSDIDLIFCYPRNVATQGGRRSVESQVFYNKVAQKLVNALDQQTVDGRVFRVDMRLRPFGDSGPLVMSLRAMEDYYQEQGREWERYAMLKARLIGTPSPYWREFYDTLRPFVYRRYIDFSVIESLRKMKSLIAQEVRRKGLTDNIKLGAGGIREVEFIAQALQMIRGGREPQLRTESLLLALNALAKQGVFSHEDATQLSDHYLLLRRVEQYLQQFDDQQTQTLPNTEQDWQRLNFLLCQPNTEQSRQLIDTAMHAIHHEFTQVVGFDNAPHDNVDNQFVLIWEQNDNLALSELIPDLQACDQWQQQLHEFKQRITKAHIGRRGRDILDKLMPATIAQVHQLNANSDVFALVCNVLSKIVSRTAYLELLLENPAALKQLVRLCSHSKWIGEHIARYPILLDELIDPVALYQPLAIRQYKEEIRQYFLRIEPDDLELQMEALRQFKQTHQLRIAAADATDKLSVIKVSDHLTALAEAIIEQAVNLGWQQVTKRFGSPQGTNEQQKGFAVIAYGKSGGYELGYGSDLDLVFVHNHDEQSQTTGQKVISSRQFYLKLAQRLMHLFNTRTSSGILYELDTRLRPDGESGLLAINLESYNHYQQTQAWTWEHQALVRARMVLGEAQLVARFQAIRHNILSAPRDAAVLAKEVSDMREKMRQHLNKGTNELVDLKQDKGTIADIEFISQYLVLSHSHTQPSLAAHTDNIRILHTAAKSHCISEQDAKQLIDAYCHYRQLSHIASLRGEQKLAPKAQLQPYLEQVKCIWEKVL